jgi:hypothetical protein
MSKPRPPLDLTDPAAVTAWGGEVRARLFAMRPLISEATTRKAHRQLSRRSLRTRLSRMVRDLGVMLDALVPRPAPPASPPPLEEEEEAR